jgi:hypothetical protein
MRKLLTRLKHRFSRNSHEWGSAHWKDEAKIAVNAQRESKPDVPRTSCDSHPKGFNCLTREVVAVFEAHSVAMKRMSEA